MRLVVKKLDVVNLDQLQSLVVEHIDGIETGLTVLDSRLLLGHATVDIVAVDAHSALVLVTTGFTADEEMLLKAVDAYSWCLEYPEAIRRLYPSVDVSTARPPRLMFVVERMPDAFHRKIKQLGFCEVDCVEFRHLDVGGTQAAYFDTIARLRRGAGVAEFQPAPIARRVSEPSRREPGDRSLEHGDKVVPLVSAPNSARATSVRLQKMLNTSGHTNGGAPVIDIASRAAAPRIETPAATAEPAAPRAEVVRIDKTPRVEKPSKRVDAPVPVIELPRQEVVTPAAEPVLEIEEAEVAEAVAPRIEKPAAEVQVPVVAASVGRVSLREAIPVPAPVATAARVQEQTEPRVSFAEIAKELLGAPGAAANGRTAGDAITRAKLEEVAAAAAESVAEANGTALAEAPVAPKPVFTAPKSITPAPTPITPAPQPIAPAPKPIAPAPKPIAPGLKPITPAPQPTAPKPIAPAPKPIAPGLKPGSPAPAPAAPTPKLGVPAPKPAAAVAVPAAKPAAAAATEAKPGAAETAAQNLPQEFEGLKFPNDGVLTRQWMEFLNQMASGK
jgi:hypothetical protein